MTTVASLLAIACAERGDKRFQSAQMLYREGRFVEATDSADAGYRAFRDPQSEWHWKFAILSSELQLLRGKTAAADVLLAQNPPSTFRSLMPRYEMLRGYSLARHKQFPAAQDFLKRAISDAHKLGDSEAEADAWLWLGTAQLTPDQFPTAELSFRKAEELAEARGLAFQKAEALNNRAFLQLKRERYADAIPMLEAARNAANEAGAGYISALASTNLSACYENLGDLDKALAAQKSAVQQQERFGLETLLNDGYSELGTILFKKGDTEAAIQYLQKAFHIVGKDAPIQYSIAAANLASILQQTGALDQAEHFNQIAFQYADQNDTSGIAELTSTQAAISEQRGQHQQALALNERVLELATKKPSIQWQTYARLAAIYGNQGDFQNADANYSKALAVIATNRADQLKSDYKITFLSNLIRFYQDYVALLMQHGDSDRALQIADSSRASVLTEDLAGKSEPSRSTLIAQLRRVAKTSHAVFLFYWLAPKQSYLWVITALQSKAIPLADEKQIQQDVLAYRTLIEEQRRDPLAVSSPAGLRLFQNLIAPAASFIPKDGNVVIVPDGVLHNLNFETLLVPLPAPHYWIEDITISIAPSLGILQSGKSATSSAHRSLLLIGNPVTKGTGYPELPESAAEIANIQRQFPSTDSNILTGDQAFADAYFAAKPEKYSTIHFATHVDANAQSPLDSAIILSPQPNDYRLYARDVARTPLTADLVTISACRGAGARALSGEGLVGFAWAFFQARARNVVTSMWDVSDQSTAQLMGNFYGGVQANRPYARALHEAKLQMLHNSQYQRPYYWAPFQLYSRTVTTAAERR